MALTLAEREEISRAMAAGFSIRSIAVILGRSPSTISREIKRNGGLGCYRATQADQAAWDRARRPKRCRLAENRDLARIVTEKLRLQWSLEQIVGWLKHTYSSDETSHVSHETIYRSLFIQARGALKKELLQHLRRTRGMRRSRQYTQKTDVHGRIVDAVSISERPATIEDRAVPGHWEGDLLFGSANSQIATLVERQTRYVMLVKLDGKDSQTVVSALIKNARKLPQELYKSLTWDRGTGDARSQEVHVGHRHSGVLLRSAEPMAARKQREHEWIAQAVHAEGHGHLRVLTASTQRDRETIEREAAQDARLPYTR